MLDSGCVGSVTGFRSQLMLQERCCSCRKCLVLVAPMGLILIWWPELFAWQSRVEWMCCPVLKDGGAQELEGHDRGPAF